MYLSEREIIVMGNYWHNSTSREAYSLNVQTGQVFPAEISLEKYCHNLWTNSGHGPSSRT